MTDKQFETFLAGMVRELEDIKEELENKHNAKSAKLERLLSDYKNQLKRP